MKNFILIMLLVISGSSFAQKYIVPTNLVDKVLVNPSLAASKDVILSSEVSTDNIHEFSLTYWSTSQTLTETFRLKPLTHPEFESKFKAALIRLMSQAEDNSGASPAVKLVTNPVSAISSNEKEIALLFTQVVTFYNTEDEMPQVATIYLQENIPVYYDSDKINSSNGNSIDSLVSVGTLEKVSVEISFYGGFIEKIQVNGIIKGKDVSLNNKYSIGISSTRNISQLGNNRLYSNEKFLKKVFDSELKNSKQYDKVTGKHSLYIYADDVIRYVKKVDVNANDISPVPQVVLLDNQTKSSKLYKEQSTKLFEAVVFTDFLGIFDEENPNGIVQTEVSKRFNINTRRVDRGLYALAFPPALASEGIGIFQHFDAKFQFSKIEKDNKFLVPENYTTSDDSGVITTEQYFSPLSLYQHRIYSVGGCLNLVTMENQNSKLNMYLNMGILFGRTGVKENESDEVGIYMNNIEVPFEYGIHLLPEKRFSIIFADRLSWFEVLDSEINVRSLDEDILVSKRRWLNSFNIDVNIDLSSTGRLFLRYRLIHELDNINNNFSQLQFGYSFFILKNNGSKKENIRFD